MVNATRWTDAWTTFANVEKAWALHQDQLPSVHPVAADMVDIQAVEVNFDGITYAKGASVLKQLAAYVGVDSFFAGVRAYFREFAFGNTELKDLFKHLEAASGRDLSGWSREWLESAGVNTMRADFEVADEGIVRRERVELDVSGARTEVPELVGQARPDLVLVNDDDLTFTKIRLDERSLATVVESAGQIRESLPRALVFGAAWDMTRDGEMAARDYVRLVVSGIDGVDDVMVAQTLLRQAHGALVNYADRDWRPIGQEQLADRLQQLVNDTEPGSDLQLAYVNALAATAVSETHLSLLRGLLDGALTVEGLTVDTDLRWTLLRRLVTSGKADE